MTQTGISPGAGGNLAHTPKNDNRLELLDAEIEKLAAIAGQGEDVQVKYLLLITQAAFDAFTSIE